MTHPSVFALKQFVDARIDVDAAFEAHVSACDACAGALQRLARRALASRGLAGELAVAKPLSPLVTGVVAMAASLAVMLVSRAPLPVTSASPEGMHGVAVVASSTAPLAETKGVDAGRARLNEDEI